ncbi:type III-A CRISPR-associated RAMP protein Csm4 [Macrococcus capreoli]
METLIVKLSFLTPVHFGKRRLADSEQSIKADTLFSALFIEAIQLDLDTKILLDNIVISDTFPYIEETLYLPKPLIKISSVQQDDNYKVFKKLKYIPVNQFNEYLKGNISSDLAESIIDEFNLGQVSTETKVSLVEVDNNGEPAPFSVGTFKFNKNAGLYFMVNIENKNKDYFITLMDALQYSGLGGKRHSGYGRFEYEIISNYEFFNASKTTNNNILLSSAMFNHNEADKLTETDRYTLSKRTGYIQSVNFEENLVKKRDFFSFYAGSVFKNRFEGYIADVGENGQHPVYRYAKAFWLGV